MICDLQTPVEYICRIQISQLHPTQGGIGLIQVENEVAELKQLSAKKIDKLITKKVIPIVIAPTGYYLVDRHHLTSALWRVGVREVEVKVIGRINQTDGFWQKMEQNHWAWLKNQQGMTINPAQLPANIEQMVDYPYRSLAGMLQDDGYFDKNKNSYFVEFAWAQWLGQQMKWQTITCNTIKQQLKQAEKLACISAANGLPGYFGQACC